MEVVPRAFRRFEGILVLVESLFAFLVLGVDVVDLLLDRRQFRFLLAFVGRERGLLDFDLPDLRFDLLDLLLFAVDLDERLSSRLLGLLDALLGGRYPVFQPGDLAFDLLDFSLDRELFVFAFSLDLGVAVLEVLFEAKDRPPPLVEFRLEVFEFRGPILDVAFRRRQILAFLLEFRRVEKALVFPFLVPESLVLEGGVALLLESIEAVALLLDA